MPTVDWDVETYCDLSLTEHGAYLYAKHPSARPLVLCYAIDDGEVQTWRPDDPPPAIFLNAADRPDDFWFVSDNWTFENLILEHVLIPRYGFRPIPIERQDCAQRLALANGYPAELGLRCEALGLPYKKDPEARKAMLRITRPKTAKSRRKAESTEQYQADLALVIKRCRGDVAATRAAYNAPQLKRPSAGERQVLLVDAAINRRGVCANVPFLTAAREMTVRERNNINARLDELTCGAINSVDQRDRILKAVNERGHHLSSLTKRSVAAALAHQPDNYVQELLTLRQQGAFASVRKFKTFLNFADPEDRRVRDTLRYCGSATGRWSSLKPQLQNLKRNDLELPAFLVDAITAGNRDMLARFGNPLTLMGELSRAALCAAPGKVLISVDLSAIESRILAWFAGEQWKLDTYTTFDRSGDKTIEPYRVVAHRMLRKTTPISEITTAERQMGKAADLGLGFGGSIGAWRKISQHDPRTDAEIGVIVRQWRDAHPAVTRFWKEVGRAVRVAIRVPGQPMLVLPAPRPPITALFADHTLTLTLPSGRAITYPQARLAPNRKFEDADPDVEFMDNSKGQWKPARAWFGTAVENLVQGCARDLLAAALVRFEARGLPVVHHAHDEVTVEVPEGSISEQEVLAILLESPPWATGLPLNGKVRTGVTYLEAPATAEPPQPETEEEIVEAAVDAFVADMPELVGVDGVPIDPKYIEKNAEDDFLASLGETIAPLTELVTLPMSSSNHVCCPFHEEVEPSCKIYADHFHCYGCGEHGDRIAWLTKVEGMSKAEAMAALQDSAVAHVETTAAQQSAEDKYAYLMQLWTEARPLIGSPAERYLRDTRGINTSRLPASIHDALRFHPRCPFGANNRVPCLIALMRNPLSGAPVGLHRTALKRDADGRIDRVDRKMFGKAGVVQLWPANGNEQLVVGEGLETTLAAAVHVPYHGAPLTPAWSALTAGGLKCLPVLPGVARLILLIDNDENSVGQKAATHCRQVWDAAGRSVAALVPKHAGWDFNDEILGRKA